MPGTCNVSRGRMQKKKEYDFVIPLENIKAVKGRKRFCRSRHGAQEGVTAVLPRKELFPAAGSAVARCLPMIAWFLSA